MATVTFTVQSMLNAATYDSYTKSDAIKVSVLKTQIAASVGLETDWFELSFNNQVLDTNNTLAYYGITNGSVVNTANRIGRLATKELKQKAKLDLAALDRAASANPRSTFDITTLPTQYNDDSVIDNANAGGLILGRPWINTVAFTFYEAFGTTSALTTTQYVHGNKIYVYSSSLDVPGYQNANIIVNEIEIYNAANRGHTLAILDPYGDTISITSYDTWGNAGTLTTLASALNAVDTGNIVVLTVWDASALNATVRSSLTTYYGSTNSNTWTASRVDHIFIGIRN